jgi:hypothetical protein
MLHIMPGCGASSVFAKIFIATQACVDFFSEWWV